MLPLKSCEHVTGIAKANEQAQTIKSEHHESSGSQQRMDKRRQSRVNIKRANIKTAKMHSFIIATRERSNGGGSTLVDERIAAFTESNKSVHLHWRAIRMQNKLAKPNGPNAAPTE